MGIGRKMAAPRPFRSITSAPTDAAVEVIHGKPQAVALAVWDARLQVWVKVDDPKRRALHRVTGWRPIGGMAG
jgi:hypothetical protein